MPDSQDTRKTEGTRVAPSVPRDDLQDLPQSSSGATPGPWYVQRKYEGSCTIAVMRDFASRMGPAVAVHGPENWIHRGDAGPEMIDANARLIAAAPDLLDACKEFREACAAAVRVLATMCSDAANDAWQQELDRLGISDGFGVRGEAAIAKAEGR